MLSEESPFDDTTQLDATAQPADGPSEASPVAQQTQLAAALDLDLIEADLSEIEQSMKDLRTS